LSVRGKGGVGKREHGVVRRGGGEVVDRRRWKYDVGDREGEEGGKSVRRSRDGGGGGEGGGKRAVKGGAP